MCLEGGQSVVQSEVLLSNTIRLLGILLHTKCHALQPHLSHLQLSISKKVSVVLEHEENVEVKVTRSVGLLLIHNFAFNLLWLLYFTTFTRLPFLAQEKKISCFSSFNNATLC